MLGKTIKDIRDEKGLTQVELSHLTQLSTSLISQVEKETVEPSVQTLRKIAHALDVPLMMLFQDEVENKGNIVRKAERKKIFHEKDHVTYELLSPDLNRKIEFLLTRLEPWGWSSDRPLGHEGEEVALVSGGTVKFYIGTESYVLEDGDTVYFDSYLPHRMQNLTDREVEIISAVTPPSF